MGREISYSGFRLLNMGVYTCLRILKMLYFRENPLLFTMAHPFFEVNYWPADRKEAMAFYKQLSDAIRDVQRIRDLYDQCSTSLPGLPPGVGYDVLWNAFLRNVTAGGFFRKFSLIIKQQYPGNELMQQAILDIEKAIPTKDRRIISIDTLLLDRDPLRESIEKITPEASLAKVLLVTGDTKSGKSHAHFLFDEFAVENGALPVYLSAELVSTLEEVLDELFSFFGPDATPPPQNGTPEAWYKAICRRLQTFAIEKDKMIWIAMDDLGTDENGTRLLVGEIKAFFDQFALQMVKPVFRRYFRLMLIHYPMDEPPKFNPDYFIAVTKFSESDIGQEHVEQLLQEWRDSTGKFLSDEKIKSVATEVISTADTNAAGSDAPRLKRIHTILKDKIQLLKQQP